MAARRATGARLARDWSRVGVLYFSSTLVLCVAAVVIAWLASSNIPNALTEANPAPVPVTAPVTADVIREMSPIYAVDGRPVIAYTGTVFYRDLAAGDEGEDVAEPFVVAEVKVQEGQPAPSVGETVATAQPSLGAIDLVPAEGFDGPPGTYVFTFEGLSAEFVLEGDSWTATNEEDVWIVAPPTEESPKVQIQGSLRFLDTEEGLRVPASAIIVGSSQMCVALETRRTHR